MLHARERMFCAALVAAQVPACLICFVLRESVHTECEYQQTCFNATNERTIMPAIFAIENDPKRVVYSVQELISM